MANIKRPPHLKKTRIHLSLPRWVVDELHARAKVQKTSASEIAGEFIQNALAPRQQEGENK